MSGGVHPPPFHCRPPSLSLSPPLTSLDLSGNLLGAQGSAALAALLRRRDGHAPPLAFLRCLNLASNQIRQGGCTEIASALRENATLQTLVLHSNGLQAGGATALAEALCAPLAAGALTSLDVSNNAMDVKGVSAMAMVQKFSKSTLKKYPFGSNLKKYPF